jgi:hypothetical protein
MTTTLETSEVKSATRSQRTSHRRSQPRHEGRRDGGRVCRPRRRRILHHHSARPGRNAKRVRLARHRRSRLLRAARRQHLLQRFFRRRHRAHVEVRARTGEDLFRRSLRRHSRSRKLGSLSGDLHLYHEDVYSLPGPERIDYARRAEKAALDADPRIKNSEGGSFDAATGRKVLANSHGFLGEYRRSYCSVAVVPIAQDADGGMQRDYWYSVARSLAKLDSAEQVGKEAARRTLRRLGARKVKTAHVPVVLDPMVARSMLEHIFEGVNGDSVYRGASFLAGKLGEKIAGGTSPWSTTAPCPAASAPRPSTAKAFPRAAPW